MVRRRVDALPLYRLLRFAFAGFVEGEMARNDRVCARATLQLVITREAGDPVFQRRL
jgi:hypothetical protein